MKKLMIALAAVAMAAYAQAGLVKWSTMTGLIAAGETSKAASGTLQLLAVAAGMDAATVWASVKDGSFSAIKSASLDSAGKIAAQTFDYTNGSYDFYSILVDGDNFFMSGVSANKGVTDVGSASIQASLKSVSSSGTIMDASKGYSGAGWYGNVPEPTSGVSFLSSELRGSRSVAAVHNSEL